jgi:DNA-binding SARP family transcriptional activator
VVAPGRFSFAILGPLEVRDGDRRVRLGPFKQRMVLGLLLCRANRVVPVDAFVEALWDGAPPRSARKNIQVHVSALRGLLGDGGGPHHCPPGYLVRVGPDGLDALRMVELARSGRREVTRGDLAAAADLFGRAVRLWRGPPLPDLATSGALAAEADQMAERYLAVYEDWAETELALGRHADVVDGIEELVRGHPFRERLRHAHLLALHRCGRTTEALARFDELRQVLARELGLEPSPVLQALHRTILTGDGSPPPAGPVTVTGRTTVTARPDTGGRGGSDGAGLPADLADFTGREPEVGRIIDTLTARPAGSVVALTGAVGAGKTALAVHSAHRLGGRFPGGRFLIGLRTGDGTPRDPADLAECAGRAVRPGGPSLVVLDDAAGEAQVRAVLAATGGAVALVTGRRWLGGLESAVHVRIGPMPDEDALRLLARHAGAARVAAEPDAARRLIGICRGLPLLVRIVGAKLDELRHLTLDRYARRLADSERLLDELAAGDLRLRPRLAVAVRDLVPDERAALRALAGVAPVFTAPEAAERLGTSVARAELMIERLVEANLVEVRLEEVRLEEVRLEEVTAHADAVRYEMPSAVTLFAVEGGGAD